MDKIIFKQFDRYEKNGIADERAVDKSIGVSKGTGERKILKNFEDDITLHSKCLHGIKRCAGILDTAFTS